MFSMKMEMGFKRPLARQIREGVEIEMSRNTLMNSKSEWNHSRIPRIVIEAGENQSEDLESGLGSKGEREKRERKRILREGTHTQTRNPKRRGTDESVRYIEGEVVLTTREKRQ